MPILLMKSTDDWDGRMARCLIREFRIFYLNTYVFYDFWAASHAWGTSA